jgi:hypothetical protein
MYKAIQLLRTKSTRFKESSNLGEKEDRVWRWMVIGRSRPVVAMVRQHWITSARERRERSKKGCTPIQVRASRVNRIGVIESRHLLWRDWWTRGARRLGRQLRHSRRRDSVAPDDATWLTPTWHHITGHAQAPWVVSVHVCQPHEPCQCTWCDFFINHVE